MEGTFHNLAYGFSVAITPLNLLAAFLGAALGTFVGVLPGIGAVGAMALLLTATVKLQPETALIMLAGIYYGAQYGGTTTSVLLNVPGEPASVVTCLEGYEMAKKGRAGAALAVSAVGSFIGGSLGIIGLMMFAPVLARFALSFGPPEYFALALLGMVALSRVSSGSLWKGLLMLGIGLTLATVGMDTVSGMRRYTFGVLGLAQGIDLVVVAMGLFGMSELLTVAESAGGMPQAIRVKLRDLFPTSAEWKRSFPPILRASGLGFLVGLIPGPAPLISTFASYNMERKLAKNPSEFGHGAIEGVAGPETANNAATSGAMVPLLALGIPFAASPAMLLAGLMIHDVQPGPLLMQEHPQIFWGVVASMYIGNVALLIMNLPLVGFWVSLLRIPQPALLGSILLFMLLGTYSMNNSLLDLVVLLTSGVAGYVLRKMHFGLAPVILGMVLGPMLEENFRQSLYMSGGDPLVFFLRPIAGVLWVALVALIIVPVLLRARRRRTKP
jgi:putative tricarboxylic transport membrane protein